MGVASWFLFKSQTSFCRCQRGITEDVGQYQSGLVQTFRGTADVAVAGSSRTDQQRWSLLQRQLEDASVEHVLHFGGQYHNHSVP
jgi:Tfp pilus assembly pilus retraction ATPase PilT